MAISFVAAANAHNYYASATLNISKPTGTANGDVLIAIVGGTPNTLSGWTSIGSASSATPLGTVHAFWKLASGEPSSYSWTLSTSSWDCYGVIVAYRGCDSGTPVDTTHTTTAAHTATAFTPSAVTTGATQLMVGWAMGYRFDGSGSTATTWTTTSATSRSTASDVEGGSPNNEETSYVVCDRTPGAGSNTQTLTASQGSDGGVSGLILLNPAGVSASAGNGSATAVAYGPTATLIPGAAAGRAVATASAFGPSAHISPTAGLAQATATALTPCLGRLGISASAVAGAKSISANIGPTQNTAHATAAAYNARAGIGAIAGAAAVTVDELTPLLLLSKFASPTRRYFVPLESRTLTVPTGSRYVYVPYENRTLGAS